MVNDCRSDVLPVNDSDSDFAFSRERMALEIISRPINCVSTSLQGTGLKGRVGSRIVFYRSRDIAEDSKPTLEISRPGRIDPETKIIYQTKETIYSPNFDKN